MASLTVGLPATDEHASFYGRYISLIGDPDIIDVLSRQQQETMALLSSRNEKDGDYRYAPGKWTLKEVVGHMNDAERIFAYRALRIARNDKTPLAGFEQDDYIANGPFAECRLANLVQEFSEIRQSTLSLLRNFQPEAWMRRGTASGYEITVRALAYTIAGHELHHQKILREKYLPAS
jgi:hypothetical protein